MIDPFTALGAASSIVQFVDFGSKLLIEGYGLYKSKEGASKENLIIEELVTETETFMGRLLAPMGANRSPTTQDEVGLQKLAQRCFSLAQEILDLLEELKVDPNARFRTWESLRKAARKTRKASSIERMRKELEKMHTEINTFLVKIMGTSLANAFDDLQRKSNDYHLENTQNLTMAKQDLMDAVRRQKQETKDFFKFKAKKEQEQLAAVVALEASLNNLELRIDRMMHEGAKVATEQSILRSLHFTTMQDRHIQIEEAYPQTFTWIFESGTTTFADWLRTQGGIFWVSGKAGSGKSTLMKYLNDHKQTVKLLNEWAATQVKQLHLASFYFWNSGTKEQNSQEGLLKTLLYQILRQCPELIPWASERRWKEGSTFHLHPDKWSRSELSQAIENIIARGTDEFSYCFCFFVDGLDEYEGDHYLLIRDLEKLTASDSVKMCVSSRPWTVFREHYGQDQARKFVLQELTQPDMDKFVKGRLEEDPRFKRLAQNDPRADYFVTEISKRAEGVFLWVFLVVRSLLSGMAERDNFDALQKRLNDLPSDLEAFFRHILDRIEPTYQEPMARMLLLAVKAFLLPLEAAYYLLEDAKHPDFALNAEFRETDWKEWSQMRSESRNLVHAWCKDLLEVKKRRVLQGPFTHEIGFLHRTVRDFLVTRDMEANLSARTGVDFSPWLTLVRVHLRRGKLLGSTNVDNSKLFMEVAKQCLDCAKAYETISLTTPAKELLELDRVGVTINDTQTDRAGHWCSNAAWSVPSYLEFLSPIPRGHNFLAFAIVFDLDIFVKEQLAANPAKLKNGDNKHFWPLLTFALHALFEHSEDPTMYFPSWNVVQSLLHAGADPNESNPSTSLNQQSKVQKSLDESVWSLFLARCQDRPHAELWPIAQLMLTHGADPTIQLGTDVTFRGRGYADREDWEDKPKVMTVSRCLEASFVACGYEKSKLEYYVARASPSQSWHAWMLSNVGHLLGFPRGRS